MITERVQYVVPSRTSRSSDGGLRLSDVGAGPQVGEGVVGQGRARDQSVDVLPSVTGNT